MITTTRKGERKFLLTLAVDKRRSRWRMSDGAGMGGATTSTFHFYAAATAELNKDVTARFFALG